MDSNGVWQKYVFVYLRRWLNCRRRRKTTWTVKKLVREHNRNVISFERNHKSCSPFLFWLQFYLSTSATYTREQSNFLWINGKRHRCNGKWTSEGEKEKKRGENMNFMIHFMSITNFSSKASPIKWYETLNTFKHPSFSLSHSASILMVARIFV